MSDPGRWIAGLGVMGAVVLLAWLSGYPAWIFGATVVVLLVRLLLLNDRTGNGLTSGRPLSQEIGDEPQGQTEDDSPGFMPPDPIQAPEQMIEQLQSLTNAFPDPAVAIDGNDGITWFNEAASSLLGLQSPQDIGRPITNFCRDPDFADWLAVHYRSHGQVRNAGAGRRKYLAGSQCRPLSKGSKTHPAARCQ